MLKNKRLILVAGAVVFIVVLFFIKHRTEYTYTKDAVVGDSGLSYGNETLGDLINQDADSDGVLDWEESLWGTNPAKRDTDDDGIPDNVAIENFKQQMGQGDQGEQNSFEIEENLTETDKFSRDFFATVATLNQGGEMDQETVDKLGESLSERMQNSKPRKVFLLTDIKVSTNNSAQAIIDYRDTLGEISNKYPIERAAIDVLQEALADENNINVNVLSQLDPIIRQMKNVIMELGKMDTPQSMSLLHLDLINAMERIEENLSDIKLYETDAIVALTGISQYEKNTTTLELISNDLANAINQKLNN